MSIAVLLPVSNTMPGLAPGKSGDMENNNCSNSDFENSLKSFGSMPDKPETQENASMETVFQPEMGLQFLLNQIPEQKEEAGNIKTHCEEGGNVPAEIFDSKGLLPTLTEPTELDSGLVLPKPDSSDQTQLINASVYGIAGEANAAGEGRSSLDKMPQSSEPLSSNQGAINISEVRDKGNPKGQKQAIRSMTTGNPSNQALVEKLSIKAGVDSQARTEAGSDGGIENHAGKDQKAMEVNQLISLESERMRGTKNSEDLQGNTKISEGEAAWGATGKSGTEPVLLNRETISQKPISSKQMIEQVIKSMEHMPLSRSSDVTIKLEPQSLGKLHIHLQIRDDVIVATFSTENHLAKQLLESGLGNLRMQLESSGIRLERAEVNVDLGNEWGFASSDWSESDQSRHQFHSAAGYEPNLIMTKMSMDEWTEEEAPVNYSGDATVNYLI
ncbi:MAG: hypothetical protein GXY50_07235 [Syntrophomonadaceae bacterium]|nr:hypothetical protein [Syntrophomonadaceae bacterium]